MTQTSEYPTNEIGNIPGVSTFGGGFSYAAWTPNTTVTLCNVPWNADYRDVAYFPSKTAFNSWLDDPARQGPSVILNKLTYARAGAPIRLNLPFERCYQFNYIRVVNGAQPVTGHNGSDSYAESGPQTLYYFITNIEYVAPNTTLIQVQLDVWQSFCHSVQFGNCYIERGHIGIANENQFSNNGRDYLTVPEGLDTGSEYQIAASFEYVVADNSDPDSSSKILVASTTSLVPPYGTVDDPTLKTASGNSYGNLPNGCDFYYFSTLLDWQHFLEYMQDKPWVTQGIVSVTAVTADFLPANEQDEFGNWRYDVVTPDDSNPTLTFYRIRSGSASKTSVIGPIPDHPNPELRDLHDRRVLAFNWRDGLLPTRYANLKKFLTSPYTVVELTSYSGTPLLLKPECMAGTSITVIQKTWLGLPSPRIAWMPYQYNAKAGATNVYDPVGAITNDGGEMFDMMTGIFNLPSFTIVNNGGMAYLAANAHGIAYQHANADWSQTRAMMGAGNERANSLRGIETGYNNAQVGVNAMMQGSNLAQETAGYRAIQSGVNSGIQGVAAGGGAGAGMAATGMLNAGASFAIEQNQIQQQSAISQGAAQSLAANNRNLGMQNTDSNYELAAAASQGDYANAIAGINARVQDTRLIQPTTAGQMGGDAFNLAMFKWGVFAKVKQLQPALMAAIGEYWLRYGYAINRFGRLPNDYQVMDRFTYWKLRETYITSSTCPEIFRQTIRGIFEKGVTVWNNPSDIGNIDLAINAPKDGVTL